MISFIFPKIDLVVNMKNKLTREDDAITKTEHHCSDAGES